MAEGTVSHWQWNRLSLRQAMTRIAKKQRQSLKVANRSSGQVRLTQARKSTTSQRLRNKQLRTTTISYKCWTRLKVWSNSYLNWADQTQLWRNRRLRALSLRGHRVSDQAVAASRLKLNLKRTTRYLSLKSISIKLNHNRTGLRRMRWQDSRRKDNWWNQ